MPAALPDRRLVLAVAAAANVDPRTVRRFMKGERVHPAIADAIELAQAAVLRVDGPREAANG